MAYDPFFSTNPVVDSIEQHRGKVEQTRENTARLAAAFATYKTEGDGEFLLEEPHLFGCTFTEQPIVAYGFALDHGDNEDPLVPGALPRGSGGVRKWVKDARGYFTGAYVFFAVDTSKVERTSAPAEGEETPEPSPTDPPTGSTPTFTDDFDRPNSALIGNGWQQTGGDFFIDTNRAITRDASSYMGQGFGHKSMSMQADLRSPDNMEPCIYVWSNSTAGGNLGYCFSFNPLATGHNFVLRRSDQLVATNHVGPPGVAIGNVFKKLKLTVTENIPLDIVQVRGFIDGVQVLTYDEPIEDAPTGSYAGVGNRGGPGKATGGTVVENVIMGQLAGVPADGETPEELPDVPEEAVPTTPVPVYKIAHDFTFTGIALKDLPEYLLDPAVTG